MAIRISVIVLTFIISAAFIPIVSWSSHQLRLTSTIFMRTEDAHFHKETVAKRPIVARGWNYIYSRTVEF